MAGTGAYENFDGRNGDGGPATRARVTAYGLRFDRQGDLFFYGPFGWVCMIRGIDQPWTGP